MLNISNFAMILNAYYNYPWHSKMTAASDAGMELLILTVIQTVCSVLQVYCFQKMTNADRDHVAIDVEEMLANAQPLFTTECCIYEVPYEIRRLNEDAYTPHLVSIGPLHHGDPKLLSMEGHKKVYCQYFLKRSREISLDNVVSCLRELEPRIRRSYSKNIELGVDEFIKVILVDCGFIIELLVRYYNFMETDHDIIGKPWLLEKIRYDLLLLENQIPFFVLEKLWNLAFQSSPLNGDDNLSLLKLACYYLCPTEPKMLESSICVAHFTDLGRISFLKPFNRNLSRTNEVPTLHYSASELNEAGVKFKVNREEKSLLELKFSGKCLQVPEIEVDDGTETWFRNMVALEQCHYLEESYITDYVIFIGHLVNEGKDVDVLVKNKIIVNRLGDNETVAELFRGLKRDIMVMNSDAEYTHICNQLNAYYENFWHKMMATLRIDYFSTPWKTAASVAAIILLFFTVIQTVCSVLSIVKY